MRRAKQSFVNPSSRADYYWKDGADIQRGGVGEDGPQGGKGVSGVPNSRNGDGYDCCYAGDCGVANIYKDIHFGCNTLG